MFRYSSKNSGAPVAYSSFGAMHTRMELLFVHPDEKEAGYIAESVEKMVREEENRFSRHISGSGVSLLNASEGRVQVDDGLYFALELCEQVRKATCGFFDVAALSDCRKRPAYRTFPQGHAAERCSPQVVLDFGGFAKGYALEKARKMLTEAGVTCALLNFGDSSAAAIGSHPFGENWNVSPVKKPDMTIPLKDSSLSVSGCGVSGSRHIVNPVDGTYPVRDHDIGVTGRSALLCEMLSTALFAAPPDREDEILASFKGYEALRIG